MNREENKSGKEDWDFYFSNVNDVLSSLMVNLSAIRRAPDPSKSWLLWVWVHMLDPRPDGLSSEAEARVLFEIEDRLNECLSAACGAEPLGRITGGERREFYYYAATAGSFESVLKTAMAKFTGYRFDFGKQPDPEWRQYKDVLYPSPNQLQVIHNRRVVDSLEKNGDDHAIARIVDHAIYFRSAAGRAGYANAVARLGFRVQHESEDPKSRDRPFFLNLVRNDPVTVDHINEVVAELIELTELFGGEYDGWGCEVQAASS